MQNIFTTNRIKMVLVILFTFFSVKIIAPNIFLANSPRVNPLFIASILNSPKEIASVPGKFLSSLSKFNLFNRPTNVATIPTNLNNIPTIPVIDIKVNPDVIAKAKQLTPPANIIFQYVSKGVSAAENKQTGDKYIKVEAGTKYKIVGYITLNGVKYPKIEFTE